MIISMKTEERTKPYYKPYNDNMILLSDNDCIPPIRVSLFHFFSSTESMNVVNRIIS